MSPKLLLIADDQEDNRAIFSAMLAHTGCGVFLATTGQEVAEQARRRRPDLILMDLQMPVLRGSSSWTRTGRWCTVCRQSDRPRAGWEWAAGEPDSRSPEFPIQGAPVRSTHKVALTTVW